MAPGEPLLSAAVLDAKSEGNIPDKQVKIKTQNDV